jgi:hypothetical protein
MKIPGDRDRIPHHIRIIVQYGAINVEKTLNLSPCSGYIVHNKRIPLVLGNTICHALPVSFFHQFTDDKMMSNLLDNNGWDKPVYLFSLNPD